MPMFWETICCIPAPINGLLSLLFVRPQVSDFSSLYTVANMLHGIEYIASLESMRTPTFRVIKTAAIYFIMLQVSSMASN